MTEQEIKEKYPLGSRWVDEQTKEKYIVVDFDNNKNITVFYSYDCKTTVFRIFDNLKPYTEPKTKTVYVHWYDAPGCTMQCKVFDRPYEKVDGYNVLAIKKVTLTEGEFDE